MADYDPNSLLLELERLESAVRGAPWPDEFVLSMARHAQSSALLTRQAAVTSLRSVLVWRHNVRLVSPHARNEVIQSMQSIASDTGSHVAPAYAIRAYLDDTSVVEQVLQKPVDKYFSDFYRCEILGWTRSADATTALRCFLDSTGYRVSLRSAMSLAMHGLMEGTAVLLSHPDAGFDNGTTLGVTAALSRLGNPVGIGRMLFYLGSLIQSSDRRLSNFIANVQQDVNGFEATLDCGASEWLPAYIATLISRIAAAGINIQGYSSK